MHVAVSTTQLYEKVWRHKILLLIHVRVKHFVRLLWVIALCLCEPEGDGEGTVRSIPTGARQHGVVAVAVEGEAEASLYSTDEAFALVLVRISERFEVIVRACVHEASQVRRRNTLRSAHGDLVDRVAVSGTAHVLELLGVEAQGLS